MNAQNPRTQDELALERYKIISPLLTASDEHADKGKIALLRAEACAGAGISRKTLKRWIDRYVRSGFDGLKYSPGTAARSKRISGELLQEAILLRREVPSRSVSQIIEILEMEGKAPPGFLKRSTLQDRFREMGYSAAQMKLYRTPGVAAPVRQKRTQRYVASGH
ncbi:MAG: helix-turn-helix domain-containing protein [Bacteroidales bacterium]|jgi:transposase|nr:helix-turn-helix domain-containing protein [Bacteroidales bacterium]